MYVSLLSLCGFPPSFHLESWLSPGVKFMRRGLVSLASASKLVIDVLGDGTSTLLRHDIQRTHDERG